MVGIAEDSVRFAHSGPSQRFLRGLRPLVSVGARDAVVGGMKSELVPTKPSQTYPAATVVISI